MHLTAFISRPEPDGKVKSALAITVDFDESENSVLEIISVHACGYNPTRMVDVSDIFVMDISAGLEKLIAGVDWRELAREEKRKAA